MTLVNSNIHECRLDYMYQLVRTLDSKPRKSSVIESKLNIAKHILKLQLVFNEFSEIYYITFKS